MKRIPYISLLLLCLLHHTARAANDSTIVNVYSKVLSVVYNPVNSPDMLKIKDVTLFKVSDTIILHQAKGVNWVYDNVGTGTTQGYRFAGFFEFHIVAGIKGDTLILRGKITQKDSGLTKYDTSYGVQVLKVPSFKKLAIDKPITSKPWDGECGGIVAIIADTIVFNANIDVSGKGFRGGNVSNDISQPICYTTDVVNMFKNNYAAGSKDSAGFKGESTVVFDQNNRRGKGYVYNGGGGGNGYYSGGGGGGSYNRGGKGGTESAMCETSDPNIGGWGGRAMATGVLKQTEPVATFGGGGGCSLQAANDTASVGGNGGGIVIIMANVIFGNNYSILSNGQSVTFRSSTGGAGGGAGGAILMDINEFKSKLNLSIRGGKGGSTRVNSGPGGGGSGGFIHYNATITMPQKQSVLDSIINLWTSKIGGDKGFSALAGALYAENGFSGGLKTNLIMPVKSFLFNILPANQDICQGDIPTLFQASRPKGGSGKYKYIWRKSTNKKDWTIVDSALTYQAPPLVDTTYYVRIVHSFETTDAADSIIASDTSFIMSVNVLPRITNNSVSSDTNEVCEGIAMPLIEASVPLGGDGTYEYTWQDSSMVKAKWDSALGTNNQQKYLPPYTDTVVLRRYIKSHVCYSSSNIIKINVMPGIKNNLVLDTQWLAQGIVANPLYSKPISGGTGTYSIFWQQKPTSGLWTAAQGLNTLSTYTPTLLTDTLLYRRIIFSGQHNTCKDTSNIVTIHMLDTIQNNTIEGSDTICKRSKPANFSSTLPTGGVGTYYFKWEKSTDKLSWDSIGFDTMKLAYNPGIVLNDLYFRRIVLSGHGYCVKDTSNLIHLDTRPYITNNLILKADTTICSNQLTGTINGSDPDDGDGPFKFLWETSADSSHWQQGEGIDTLKNYASTNLFTDTYIRRMVFSGVCVDSATAMHIKVLSPITNNIATSNTAICSGSVPNALVFGTPAGADSSLYTYNWFSSTDSITWQNAAGVFTGASYQPEAITKKLYFKRLVASGFAKCCKDTSQPAIIEPLDLPTMHFNTKPDSICLGSDFTFRFQLTGKAPFQFKLSDGADNTEFANITDTNPTYVVSPTTPEIHLYTVTNVIDNNQCKAVLTDNQCQLSVFEIPKSIAGKDSSICGKDLQLYANTGIGTGVWTSTEKSSYQPSEQAPNALLTADGYGIFNYTWTLDNGGCRDSSTLQLTLNEPPPNPLVGDDKKGPFLFRTTLDAQLPILGIGNWVPLDGDVYIENLADPYTKVDSLKLGANKFIWTVTNGACLAASDTFSVIVEDIKVPGGFSPNGDTINQTFKIRGLEYTKNAKLIILNKWGKEVYRSTDYKNNWEGEYKNTALPMGTYFYILNVIGRTYKGFVYIKR